MTVLDALVIVERGDPFQGSLHMTKSGYAIRRDLYREAEATLSARLAEIVREREAELADKTG